VLLALGPDIEMSTLADVIDVPDGVRRGARQRGHLVLEDSRCCGRSHCQPPFRDVVFHLLSLDQVEGACSRVSVGRRHIEAERAVGGSGLRPDLDNR
jgi:hypothetical protein